MTSLYMIELLPYLTFELSSMVFLILNLEGEFLEFL